MEGQLKGVADKVNSRHEERDDGNDVRSPFSYSDHLYTLILPPCFSPLLLSPCFSLSLLISLSSFPSLSQTTERNGEDSEHSEHESFVVAIHRSLDRSPFSEVGRRSKVPRTEEERTRLSNQRTIHFPFFLCFFQSIPWPLLLRRTKQQI
jgi:hypothetical protein